MATSASHDGECSAMRFNGYTPISCRWSRCAVYVTLVPLLVCATSRGTVGAVVPLGAEFQVNSHTASVQYAPAIAAGGNGDFVVVWLSIAPDGHSVGVLGQRYASNGSVLGTEFQVNTYTASAENDLAIAAGGNGDFVVVWNSYARDSYTFSILGQRYANDGSALGTEFQVNTYTSHQSFATSPAVAVGSNGDFVVAWNRFGEDYRTSVLGQRYASSGSALGTEFQVNTCTTAPFQGDAAIATGGNGDFVVVWVGLGQDFPTSSVFGQRYASSGSALGTEFQVNTYTRSTPPAIAAGGNGDFVVVWSGFGQDGHSLGVFGQRYASSGSALGTEFQVNTYTPSSQADPAIAVGSNGDFVVVWNSYTQDGDSDGVFGQRYASSGSALGTEFEVNTYTLYGQLSPAIAASGSGDFVVVWKSYGQDGDRFGVFGQRYALLPCPGDCDGSGDVAIDELVTGVNVALGYLPLDSCPAFDLNGDDSVAINELIAAVNSALDGCAP